MRLAAANGGKGARFAVAALMLAGLAAQSPSPLQAPPSVRGVVTRADGADAVGVEVSFHAVRMHGIAGLRAGAESVDTFRTITDAEGRFHLEVPMSLAGTCVAETGTEVGAVGALVAGPALVRIQLAPAVRRVLELAGDTPQGFEVNFEGPGPLAPRRLSTHQGTVALPDIPGHGTVLLAPPGFVMARTGDAWMPGSGYDRERLRLRSAPTRPLAVRWAVPLGVHGARRGAMAALWGASSMVWHGQLAGGSPFVCAEGEIASLPDARGLRRCVTGSSATRAVLIADVTVSAAGGELTFTVADQLACGGGHATLPTWLPASAPHLVVVDEPLGPRLLDAGGAAEANRVSGRTRDPEGASVAGVTVRVRRVAEAGKAPEPAMEATSGHDGGFVLPVRLPRGAYEVLAAAPDGRQAHRTFVVADGDPRVELVLDSGARMHGLLVDADGEPAVGVRVELLLGADDVAASFGWPERFVFTDRRGEFAFAGLQEGAAYEISCDSAAYGGVVANGAKPGEEAVLLQLRAGPTPR